MVNWFSIGRSASGKHLQQNRHYKTCWPKLQTNTIFSSHFKDFSRNSELQIERLIAKGSFGVVFQVTTRNTDHSHFEQRKLVPFTNSVYALKVIKKSQVIILNKLYNNSVRINKEKINFPIFALDYSRKLCTTN